MTVQLRQKDVANDAPATEVRTKESIFHDTWASSTDPADVAVRAAFESPTALENRYILALLERRVGSLAGKRLLDVGCGLGEASVYFALAGADVTAVDVSPEMLETAERVAAVHRVSIETAVATAAELPFADEQFDIVHVANTIHHVEDHDSFFFEVRRVLRPGGWFVSWDPLAYNPIINVYRSLATEVRTDDEEPLTFDCLKLVRRRFSNVGHRCFWIATLALFLKYFLVDDVHPNADRYWKRIYRETDRTLWWWKPLRWLDEVLTRIPLVRRLAWNVVIWGQKESRPTLPSADAV